MQEKILYSIGQSVQAVEALKTKAALMFIENVALELSSAFKNGGKVIVAGNGGSLCDAVHFAEELTGFFRKMRPALPAIALSEPGHLTCTANDVGYDLVFSRGVEAHGKKGDVFIGLSTSGNSPNVLKAFDVAKKMGLKTVSFLGKDGGKALGVADFELVIPGKTTDRIQESHMTALHILVEMVEYSLF